MTNHINIRKAGGTWVLRAGETFLGQSDNALELSEGKYPPVIYFPKADIDPSMLEPSNTTSHCPYKGDASYHSIKTDAGLIKDAGWSYETPINGIEPITGHIAFYPERASLTRL